MEREVIKQIILEQNEIKKPKIVERTLFKKIKEFADTPFVIIISGIRRCGKSTLLYELKNKDSYYVNFDDDRFFDFTINDFQELYEVLIEVLGEKDVFLFDEIQNITGWERFVRRLYDNKKKVFVSGSNASMLSKEMGTHLTGRNIPLTLYPFSFKEFLRFKEFKINDLNKLTSNTKSRIKKLFNEYYEKGGFPEYLQTEKEEYLRTAYQNILYRDIITRYKLTSEKPIKEVLYYTASNIGKEISFNTLRKLTRLTSATTIREYFEYLENSYLAFLVPRYNVSLKKQTYSNKKAYFIDTGMAKLIGFRFSKDKGRIFENLVFLALKRNNHEVYFHKEKKECDFLVRQGSKIMQAIQVTTRLLEKNKNRELEGLTEALKKYKLKEGLILTEDEEGVLKIKNKKIIIKPVWKWLLENE